MSAQPQTHAPNLGMQPTTFANPMGINGFEFVEFAAPAGQGPMLHGYLRQLGFTAVLKHKTRESDAPINRCVKWSAQAAPHAESTHLG